MNAMRAYCLVLLSVITQVQPLAGAPAPPSERPLTLTVGVDRSAYLPREPIILSWNVTNQGSRRFLYYQPRTHLRLFLQREGPGGKITELRPGGALCLEGPIPPRRLECREAVRRWLYPRGDYEGLYGTGKFTLWAECTAGYAFRTNTQPSLARLKSNQVTFEVVSPTGDDAKAVALIDKIRLTTHQPRIEAEDHCNTWPADDAVCHALLKSRLSSRLCATASLFLGLREHPDADNNLRESPWREKGARAAGYYRICLSSGGTSTEMKGIAASYLFDLTAREKGTSHEATTNLAKELLTSYPNAPFADKARRLIAESKRRHR